FFPGNRPTPSPVFRLSRQTSQSRDSVRRIFAAADGRSAAMRLKIAALGVCLAVQLGAAGQDGAFREVEQRYRSALEKLESATPPDGIAIASTRQKLAVALREKG